jgi:hypothetical protein
MYSLKNIILKNLKNYMSRLSSIYVRSLNDWLNVFYFSDYYFFFEVTTLKLVYTLSILIIIYLGMNYYIVLNASFYLTTVITWSLNSIMIFIKNNGIFKFFKTLFFNNTGNVQEVFNIHKGMRRLKFNINNNK